MRQVLFRIPLDGPLSPGQLGDVPVFGWGVVLALWVLFGAWWLSRNRKLVRLTAEFLVPMAVWLVIAAVVVNVPRFVGREYDRTVDATTEFLRKDPNSALAHYQRAYAWRSKREYARAVEDYERAIALDPNLADAHRNLAWLLATCPDKAIRDGGRAVASAEKTCKLAGYRDPLALDTLAAAYAEAGRYRDARRNAQEAARLRVASPVSAGEGTLSDIRHRVELYAEGHPFRDRSVGRSVPIYGYGLMLVLGFFTAVWTATRLGRRVGIDPNVVLDLAMWVFLSGVVGARIYYCVQYADRVFLKNVAGTNVLKSPGEMVFSAFNLPDGGLVLYGGIILAVIVFFSYCRRKGVKPLLLADVFMASFFIGLGFGRIGCLMNGCCYGDRCTLPWAILFPMGSVPDRALVDRGFVGAGQMLDVRLHPTQIYSSLNALILAALCIAYFRYRPRDGSVLALGLIVYPITRFVIEYLRGDELGQFHTSLTTAQLVSMGLLAFGLAFVAWLTWDSHGTKSVGLRSVERQSA